MSAIVKENAHPAATIVSETIQVERESQSPTRNPKLDFFPHFTLSLHWKFS